MTTILAEEDRVLVQQHVEWRYVTETSTGLIFAADTPIEVWSALITRLLAQHKRLEWSIADAINFGDRQYGEVYSQWVEETGLAKKTLANIAWVGRKLESSRRREDLDFSYHAEVAALEPPDQDRLLEEAVDLGLTRYELREAVRVVRDAARAEAMVGTSAPACAADQVWAPTAEDLTDEARRALDFKAAEVGRRHAVGFAAGWIQALRWNEARDCFTEWRD